MEVGFQPSNSILSLDYRYCWYNILGCEKYIWATSWENLFMPYANNKGADQPAHLRGLISPFDVCCLDSIISLVSISEISSVQLASVAAQASLSLTWLKTSKTDPWIDHSEAARFKVFLKLNNSFILVNFESEPQHDKTNKVSVHPAKTQISLGIHPIWSESSLSAWRKLGSLATY